MLSTLRGLGKNGPERSANMQSSNITGSTGASSQVKRGLRKPRCPDRQADSSGQSSDADSQPKSIWRGLRKPRSSAANLFAAIVNERPTAMIDFVNPPGQDYSKPSANVVVAE